MIGRQGQAITDKVASDTYISDTASPLCPASRLIGIRGPTYTACYLVTFRKSDGDKVGWLNWEDGQLTFGGNMAESATIFFEQVLKPLVDGYFETVRAKRVAVAKDYGVHITDEGLLARDGESGG